PAWKSLHLDGTLRGAFSSPALTMNLAALDFGASGYGARGLDVRAGTIPDGKGGLVWKVDGNAVGLHGSGARTTEPLSESGSFSLSGTMPARGAATLTDARVHLAALDLRFTGRMAAGAVEGALRLTRLDLPAFSPLAGRPLKGSVTFDADFSPKGPPGEIRVRMNAASKDVATGIPTTPPPFAASPPPPAALAYRPAGAVLLHAPNPTAVPLSPNVDGRTHHKAANPPPRPPLPNPNPVDPQLKGRAKGQATFGRSLD